MGKAIKSLAMKYILLSGVLVGIFYGNVWAWEGFDADSADLVEILPDNIPAPGETIILNNKDADSSQECVVESIKRNRRTVEVVARLPNGESRTLVMESR